MTNYLLDTDICIFALKNKFVLNDKIKQVGEQHCFICEMTVAEVLGQHKARLRREGNLVPDLDLMIGVTALHHNMTLVTNNTKHMSRIEGLKLENWTQSQHNEFV